MTAVVGLELAQLERGGRRARGVVLVRERRAEHAYRYAPLSPSVRWRRLPPYDARIRCARADEVVELRDRVVVVVVVDAAEADEQRVRRPQLGQELAAPGATGARRPPAAATA